MGEAGRVHAQRFTASQVVGRIEALYAEVLAEAS
jgi:hypothetical protein